MTGNNGTRIFVAGHNGMVGAALMRCLRAQPETVLLTADRASLDLTRQDQVEAFFRDHQVDQLYLAAAKVGGIRANDRYPADFLYDNLMIAANVIHAAHRAGVERLLFLGSSCIYPRLADQPMREEALLTGALEPTNEAYALAKIAGLALCETYHRQFGRDYRAVMPTNLYGPQDNFDPESGHVIPALITRLHAAVREKAAAVTIWGDGTALREFLHVDDLAAACLHVMALETGIYRRYVAPGRGYLNVGSGRECSIRALAETIAGIAGFTGRLVFDATQPSGAPRKLLDTSRLSALGWQPRIALPDGLRQTYDWFAARQEC